MKAKELYKHLLRLCDKIGFSLVHMGCEHYNIVNDKDIMTGFQLWDTRIDYKCPKEEAATIAIYIESLDNVRLLGTDTLCFGSKKQFVLMHTKNFGKGK